MHCQATNAADYLVVVTRTTCILYLLCSTGLEPMTCYFLNAKKSPHKVHGECVYQYRDRFYFTASQVQMNNSQPPLNMEPEQEEFEQTVKILHSTVIDDDQNVAVEPLES